MTSSGIPHEAEKYGFLVSALLDIAEGGVTGLIGKHRPELGALLVRMSVTPEHKVMLSADPQAGRGSPDALPRELTYSELAAIVHPAIETWKAHYKPRG